MDNWKNIDKYGRYGDTMSKKIDGDIAHVNAVEYEMSPEYIKEHGSGTINPITGKREYFDPISLTMAAVSLGSMAYKGFQNVSGRDDRSAGLRAADEQYALKKGRLDKDIRDKNIYIDHTYQSGMEKAKSAWDFAGKTLDIGTEKAITGAETALTTAGANIGGAYQQMLGQGAAMARKSGLASSGQIDAVTDPSNMIQNYATSAKKTMDTRSLDLQSIGLQRQEALQGYEFAKKDLKADQVYGRSQARSQYLGQLDRLEDERGQLETEFAGTSNPFGSFLEGMFS